MIFSLASEKTFEHDEREPLRITSSNELGTQYLSKQKTENDGEIDVFVFRPSHFLMRLIFRKF